MQIVKKYDLDAFEAWSGATKLWEIIQRAGKVGALEACLDELNDGEDMDETELNDLLWFDGDTVCGWLWDRDEDYILEHEERISNGDDPDDIDAEEEEADDEGEEVR